MTLERTSHGYRRTGLLVLLSLIIFAGSMFGRELLPPDEPRFAVIGLDMARSGDWVVPVSAGKPYLEKPPLLFWGQAVGFLLFGKRELPARIPSLLATLLLVAVIHRAGRRWFGEAAGTAGALIYASSLLTLQRGAWCAPDALLASATFGALYAFTRAAEGARWASPAAGVLLAAGLLAKGPVVLVFLVLAALASLLPGAQLLPWRQLLRPLSLLTCLALVVPWCATVLLRLGPEPVLAALWHNSVDRALNSWNNLEPWWYHGSALALGLFPWSVLLLPALAPQILRKLAGDPRLRGLGLWSAGALLLFSLPEGKRGVYLLPVYPALAMIAAASIPEIASWPRARRLSTGLGVGLALLFAGAGLAVLWPGESGRLLPPAIASLPALRRGAGFVLLAFSASMATLPFLARKWPARAILLAPLLFALATGLGWPWLLTPAINQAQGARSFRQEALAVLEPGTKLAFTRGKREVVAWYTDWRGPELATPEEVISFMSRSSPRAVVGKSERFGSPRDWPRGCRILLRGRVGRAEVSILARSPSSQDELSGKATHQIRSH